MTITDEGDDPHQSDEYLVTFQARNGRVQARYLSVEGFATNCVERVDVSNCQLARKIAKFFAQASELI